MTFRFSGHETFPCRYAWLPKAYRALVENPRALADEEDAIVELGVGKNMVRAIRFWVQVAGVAEPVQGGGHHVTQFGERILGPQGLDPYLEDIRTLWLIHWHFSTQPQEPLFAWDFLLNRWQHPEISRTDIVRAFRQEAKLLDRSLSVVTLEQHYDVFLHTYVPTRGSKGDIREDNLDCPLVELGLIRAIGERRVDDTGKREAVYALRRERKPEIGAGLFIYCLQDFWNKQHPHDHSITFRNVAIDPGSPGQILKLPEIDIRERLDLLEADSKGVFQYRDSASLQQLTRTKQSHVDWLGTVYQPEAAYV